MKNRNGKKRRWNRRIAQRESARRFEGTWFSMKDSMNEFVMLPGGGRMLLRKSFGKKMARREMRRIYLRSEGHISKPGTHRDWEENIYEQNG